MSHRVPRAKIESEGALKARAIRRHSAPRRDAACEPLPLVRLRLCRLHLREERGEKGFLERTPRRPAIRPREQPTRLARRHSQKNHDGMSNRLNTIPGAGETVGKTEPRFAIGRDGTSNMAWGSGPDVETLIVPVSAKAWTHGAMS